tara:strand:- start:2106 stop:3764 length:1659 start_codon:yes stop_codon:yes gene_type:complete
MVTLTRKKESSENSSINEFTGDENQTLSDGKKLDAFDKGFLDYVATTGSNVVPSAMHFGKTMWEMVSSPVQTAKNIGALGSSVISLVKDGEQGNEQLARDVGQFFADRYGGFENVAQTLRDDPIGFLADASIILTGGASLSARVPTAMAGAVSKNINKVAVAIDPINVGVKVTANTLTKGGGALVNVLGNTTGVGSKALTVAYLSGKSGGSNMAHLTEHMRNSKKIDETLTTAQKLIKELRDNNKNVFIEGKNGMNLAETPMDINIINKILMDFKNKNTFASASTLSTKAQKKLKIIEKHIEIWNKNPALHNAKGFDMLKKLIDAEYPTGVGNLGDSAMVVADIRSSIKDAVVKAVPEYANVMKTYEDAINVSKEIEKGLALTKNSASHTTLTKLNTAIKNNSASQFGNKANALALLDDTGRLESMIAGDALNSWSPRGISGTIMPYGAGTLGLSSGVSGGMGTGLLTGGALLAGSSPRLMGNLALGAGKADRLISPYVTPAIKATVASGLLGDYSNPYGNLGSFNLTRKDEEDEGTIININPTLEEYEESR